MKRTVEGRTRRHPLALGALSLLGVVLAGMAEAPALASAHPHALWRVVHDLCVPDARVLGLPLPCLKVDLQAGYAVLPDPGGTRQLVITPTRRIVGIEDERLQAPDAPDYWQDAWRERPLLERRLGRTLPRESLGMAVNSAPGRSQEQLHIHLSCLRPELQARLARGVPPADGSWSTLVLDGEVWRVRWAGGEDLGAGDPFKLLAADPGRQPDLGLATLVVAAARDGAGRPGFVLLSRSADPDTGYDAHGEALLDESCAGAGRAAAG